MLVLGCGAAKVNHGSQCELGMPGPGPCSPTLSVMAADKPCLMALCLSAGVCLCMCVHVT